MFATDFDPGLGFDIHEFGCSQETDGSGSDEVGIAVAFLPTGLPLTLNDTPSPVLGAAVAFLHQFRLPLLFFIAGAGSLYAPIAALWLIETTLRPIFPGFRGLVHDWTDFLEWFVVLVAGYLFASQRRLLERTEALRHVSLALAVLASLLFFCWRASPEFADFHPWETGDADLGHAALLSLARVTNLWCWVLVCVGYASRHLNRPSRALDWLNGAVYPLFCLHLTALVAVEYVVLPRDWPIALEYATITTAATLVCLALYQWGVHRSRWLAPLFGARPGAG